jgi:hypothetical protein
MSRRTVRTVRGGLLLTGVVVAIVLVVALDIGPKERDALGPPEYVYDGIPQPAWDSAVDGWIQYKGDGRFISEHGKEFYWRNGRFVNANGTLLELPASAKDHLNSLGVYKQPTIPDALAPDRQDLADEVERIRKGLLDGTLVFDWKPGAGSDFPTDPYQMLDRLEGSAYIADVSVYFKGSPSFEDLTALRDQIQTMPEVDQARFVSEREAEVRLRIALRDEPEVAKQLPKHPVPGYLEIWLKDYRGAAAFAEKLKGLGTAGIEFDDVRAESIDFPYWTQLTRGLTHEKQ